MSNNKNVDIPPERGQLDVSDTNIAVSSSEVSSVAGSAKTSKTHHRISSSSERQIKFERAQKCLENAALVSKRIKEHRKATAELLGRPFEEDDGGDMASEMASTMSERTGYSAATDISTTLSVQEALNIPGISESLANTLKQKELLMERIKQYKEISKRPIIKSSPISRRESIADSKVDKTKITDNSDVVTLQNTIKEKENALSVMQVKMKAMETTILDLQEKINEKDQIIEAKNKATTLISDSLSKKEKDTMVLLEDTRQQMIKMQENFINMEAEWKEERQRLLKEIETKNEKINNLEEANTILETSRFEISVAHSKLVENVELKNKQVLELQERIEALTKDKILSIRENEDVEEEKGSLEIANMVELTKKIELLEQLNCQIRQTNKELENKLATMNQESKTPVTSSPIKKGSPITSRKGGRNTSSKTKSPWSNISSESLHQDGEKKPNEKVAKLEMLIQSLNKDILEKEYVISQKETLISELQNVNKQKQDTINELQLSMKSDKESAIDVKDIGICTESEEFSQDVGSGRRPEKNTEEEKSNSEHTVTELEEQLKKAQEQISLLTNEIDAANRNMIKVKSNHKLKLKQMQKTIDNFSKVSDANAEIIKLNEELHQLSQKVAELEEEKGNLQLHLVDYDSGRLTESDIYKKMVEMENLAETRLKAISVLETQKFELVQELHVLQQKNVEMEDKLADMSQLQNEQVCSEIKSVQLEEQIDELTASKKELELITENLKLDKDQLNKNIRLLQEEKEELNHKLEHYIQENIELTDKLEKLSAEKVSSAESIEIVESLTTQEKLELEEYNKAMSENKSDHHTEDFNTSIPEENKEHLEKLVEESAELNKKIELFTQERQEVMERMNKLSIDNESLQEKISNLTHQAQTLQNSIEILNNEKHELQTLNTELNQQIEELKREKLEIVKDSVEIVKPVSTEDTTEGAPIEIQQDDKSTCDKGVSRTKSVKQLTKEILKLKNVIKEREAEIADCQMKILSLEEQQQKHDELMQNNTAYETKMKSLLEENSQLKEEINLLKITRESDQEMLEYRQANESLQSEIQRVKHEYSNTINIRDARIHELENLLLEYEKQVFNYGNTLQQKDKEMVEYMNQIKKLNDVSQKLKSTIELLEEEKAKDQNAEQVKSLNKQITIYQKKFADCEEKLRILEEEKVQLLSLKAVLENQNASLDAELKKLQEAFTEKQNLIKELQLQQQKHVDEMSAVMLQAKERDEEIHEIKLQLRKESIENEKLRNNLSEKDKNRDELVKEYEHMKEKWNQITIEKDQTNELYANLESKNKELLEKLKKFAFNLKKKSTMYTELENQLTETQKDLEIKSGYIEQLSIQVETLPALQEKLKHAEEELNRLQSAKLVLEQEKSSSAIRLQTEIQVLKDKLESVTNESIKFSNSLNELQNEFHFTREENVQLKNQLDTLNNKLVEYEIEQKNNINFITKISTLESDINQKQSYIVELLNKLENQEQQVNQLRCGHEAKVQERELYIENLEIEISKYKNRICRLEETISAMEDRRHSLERKADQLDSQLQEKQKAYSEYNSQEDELVSRLAILMDHDRVVEKQLHEVESENKELQYKMQNLSEENQRLRRSISNIQEHCNTLVEKANKTDLAESESAKYQAQLQELDSHLKRVTNEYHTLIAQKKQDIEELELEFNTQIENAIKEKKSLSEKYEKINEHVSVLEQKLQEYRTNIQNLNINVDELTRINQELREKSNKEQIYTPDYTEQYISEINKLNSIINAKNQEINDLTDKIQFLHTNNITTQSNLETRIAELTAMLKDQTIKIEQLMKEVSTLTHNKEELQTLLNQKEEQIKQLKEKKKVTIEMNIPKTEGMIISSTIEPVSEEQAGIDMSSLESQIVFDDASPYSDDKHIQKKITESTQKQSLQEDSPGILEEPVLVAKKAYLCYKGEDTLNDKSDPFNSDEGWGLGECEDSIEVTPGFSHLNEQIQKLKNDNSALKASLDVSNTKLIKALKKLKELKTNNDMLCNELKISKQISQSSFLDSAIEDELKNNIQELEKKIEELNADLSKEKREKEALRKQNEIINNANDRLTEIKEKLENEIELWKYKFKEANDKMSSLQWGAEPTQSSTASTTPSNVKEIKFTDEIIKLEKENEELQTVIDQLTLQNKELSNQQTQLNYEINNLNKQLEQRSDQCENCKALNDEILKLQDNQNELLKAKEILHKKLHDIDAHVNEVVQKYELLKIEYEDVQKTIENNKIEFNAEREKIEDELSSVRLSETEAKNTISELNIELQAVNEKLLHQAEKQIANESHGLNVLALTEKYSALEDNCIHLKNNLEEANKKITQLEAANQELVQKSPNYDQTIEEFNAKVYRLNAENDQLLSTVAELRSSLTSAVDQRGFEIAELWKQHLTQREADFQKVEQDLREQLNTAETKYEQLLDNVQSSSQEETNKLVIMEQVNSLQNKLHDKEEHLRNLQDQYADVTSQLDVLRAEMEDEKIMHENKLLSQQEEYEKQIQELTVKNEKQTEEYEQAFKNLQTELNISRTQNDELNQEIVKLNNVIKETEKSLLDVTNELRIKESEIYQKTHDYTLSFAQRNEEFETVRKQLIEYEKKLEDLNYEKESELAVLRLKMHETSEHHEKTFKEIEAEKKTLTEELNTKIIECINLNKQMKDLNQILEEHSSKTLEMQTALENQELEIVTLTDEINSLQDMVRSSSSKIEKHVTFASDTKPGNDDNKPESVTLNKELLDAVPRAELDLALYMLHQRDVRCEELTMELTQLLDERDTLQLRLSDSLRSYEELKSRCSAAGLDLSLSSSQETISDLPSSTLDKEQHFVDTHRGPASRSSSISDPDGEKPKLQAKLSELRTVKHSRDVRLRQESEQRQLGMRLLQRDVAQLPPEAVDQLAQAHHTLSRDSQSTSTVLLNWLRGKSTPKVVHM